MVIRWDHPNDITRLSRNSVERNLDDFYKFLTTDRLSSTRSVVYHLLSLFRRIRSLVAAAKIADDRASEVFLFCLAHLIFQDAPVFVPSAWGLSADIEDLYNALDRNGVTAALEDAKRNKTSFGLLQLYPSLAIRHGGGLLFQEAHFELVRAPYQDFFGYVGAPDVVEIGRGGTHFTPPPLARSLVEQALLQIADLASRTELRVCDPACGSGVFIHEVLRALRRIDFSGRLVLVGRDISPIAISMAKFVLTCALRDWQPRGGGQVDLRSLDSLESGGDSNVRFNRNESAICFVELTKRRSTRAAKFNRWKINGCARRFEHGVCSSLHRRLSSWRGAWDTLSRGAFVSTRRGGLARKTSQNWLLSPFSA